MNRQIIEKLEEIKSGVADIYTSKEFQKFLNHSAKFHNYSYNNQLLILRQLPSARLVASMKTWNQNGYKIIKGSKAIRVLVPIRVKSCEDEEDDIIYYKFGNVFDITQVCGAFMDELSKAPKNDLREAVSRLRNASKNEKVKIRLGRLNGPKGCFSPGTNTITLDIDNGDTQMFKTLMHEKAHSLQEYLWDYDSEEIIAESVAYVTCCNYGIDVSDYSFGYVAAWAKGKPLDILDKHLEDITRRSKFIIEWVDNNTELKGW